MLPVLLAIPFTFLIFGLVWEFAHWSVYGRPVPEDEIDYYLTKYLPDAHLNPYSDNGPLFCDMPRYVSRSQSVLSKWYIQDYGWIPRWSKWTKVLDAKRAELLKTMPEKQSLSEL
jgi:hypothetical protein